MSAEKFENRYQAAQALKERMEREVEELDSQISRLRVLYDQYFMGIEKMEPHYLRSELAKRIRRSEIPRQGTTSLKFQFRSQQQRFTSYTAYWDRIVRMIEEGTIRRGIGGYGVGLPSDREAQGSEAATGGPAPSLASMRRRFKRDIFGARRPGQADAEADPGGAAAGAAGPAASAPVAAPSSPVAATPPSQPAVEYAPADVAAIFERLVAEKRRVGEAIEKLTPAMVKSSLDRICERMPGKDLRFRIVEKDGLVSLAAVVKK